MVDLLDVRQHRLRYAFCVPPVRLFPPATFKFCHAPEIRSRQDRLVHIKVFERRTIEAGAFKARLAKNPEIQVGSGKIQIVKVVVFGSSAIGELLA